MSPGCLTWRCITSFPVRNNFKRQASTKLTTSTKTLLCLVVCLTVLFTDKKIRKSLPSQLLPTSSQSRLTIEMDTFQTTTSRRTVRCLVSQLRSKYTWSIFVRTRSNSSRTWIRSSSNQRSTSKRLCNRWSPQTRSPMMTARQWHLYDWLCLSWIRVPQNSRTTCGLTHVKRCWSR